MIDDVDNYLVIEHFLDNAFLSKLISNGKQNMGSFNNYVDRILPLFDPPQPPLRGQFSYPKRGQKQTFFDPLPPSSCPRSY